MTEKIDAVAILTIATDDIEQVAELAQAIDGLPAHSERITQLARIAAEDASRIADDLQVLADTDEELWDAPQRLRRAAEIFVAIAELPAELHELRCTLARRCREDLSFGGLVWNAVELARENAEHAERASAGA